MIREFSDWLSMTQLSLAFQSASWFVPLVQTVHIIAIAVLLSSVYFISFKLLGFIRGSQSLAAASARSMPWMWSALGVLLVTGVLLTITEPARELLNWAFKTKMVLVLTLSALLLLIQARLRGNAAYWSESPAKRSAARAIGAAALLIGAAIVTAGRWIAYV